MSSPTILAIDTSTEACSAALLYQNEIIERFEISPRKHSALILPMLQAVLDEAGITLSQLDAVAFGRGPGSFTGLRIAASVTQGIAFAKNLPVVPVSTLRALAQSVFDQSNKNTNVISAIDAYMNEIYWSIFKCDADNIAQPITQEYVCAPDKILSHLESDNIFNSSLIGIGSGFDNYHDILIDQLGEKLQSWLAHRYPEAAQIALLAANEYKRNNIVKAEEALPVYLRDNVVKE